MTYISSTELDFLRLLERTKRLVKENISANLWKVSASAKVLNALIIQLQNNTNNDIINEYRREVVQLKLLVEAENKATAEESLKIVEKIPRLFPDVQVEVNKKNKSDYKTTHESSAGLRNVQKSIYRSDLRKQLLSSSKKVKTSDDDMFMKNERLEENLANDLLSITRSLKTVMTAANDVIKEDNSKLLKMQQQVDSNRTVLGSESNRLEHHAYKCGFDCMRVFIVIFVFWTFISMVVLMKVFPKKAVN